MLVITSGIMAQSSLDSLLHQVELGNPSLKASLSLLDTRNLDAKTGLTPSNPEVEFGYMWGNPDIVGNRLDFEVTQTVDFPTAYVSRSKLSKISQHQAELKYQASRQEILIQAHKAWITRVYLNIMESLLSERLDYANKVYSGFERMWETGESNQLQLNQARVRVTTLENKINQIKRDYSKNDAELMNLTGNRGVAITDTVLPYSIPLIFDSLVSHYKAGYLNQIYQSEVEKRDQQVDVVFNQKLPKLIAGYYSESILNTTLRGVKAGITIPLWENARAVRTAEAGLVYAKDDADRYWQYEYNDLRQLYEEWGYLNTRVHELEELLLISNDEVLLRKAMEQGEISLTEYFYGSDFYFQNIKNLLEFKKDKLLIEAELRRVYY